MCKKQIIVISGINLVDGGALSVYYDCLNSLIEFGYTDKYRIIALVGNKSLFRKYADKVEFIEFADSKKSWIKRVYYEYIYFKQFSKKIKVYTWLSLHDMTPNVSAEKQFVYCHNPSPFNKMKLSEVKYGWKYYFFSKFYRYLYKINIKRNEAVIVQQDWMRKEFFKMYNIKEVIVARPSIPEVDDIINKTNNVNYKFVYPSFPRYYKNFQVLCEATEILLDLHIENFEVYITVNGTENRYSKELVDKYKKIENIHFTGLLKRSDLYELYGKANCLVFMSKLETWGMPIIEFKKTGKPIIASKLPYAYETVGNYHAVDFVDTDDAVELAKKMKMIINNENLRYNELKVPEEPFAENWEELFELLLLKKLEI